MWIRLNVLNAGNCSYIYATNGESLESLHLPTGHERTVRIWHNDTSPSLQNMNGFNSLDNTLNDQYLDFKSRVPFEHFYEAFSRSEFNDPTRYCMIRHNCSDAALYALHLAGIPVTIPRSFVRRLHAQSILHFPFPIVTPQALYQWTLAYKTQTERTLSPPAQACLRAELAAGFFRQQAASHPHLLEAAREVEAGARQALMQYPHHAETVLNAMQQGLALLTTEASTDGQPSGLHRLSRPFYLREPSRADRRLVFHLDSIFWMLALCISMYVAELVNPWVLLLLVVCAESIRFVESQHARRQPGFFMSARVPTPLSQAMAGFVNSLSNPPCLPSASSPEAGAPAPESSESGYSGIQNTQ